MTLPRDEFGFARTECACEQCVACCEILPAYLVPSDIEVIAAHLGYDDLIQFAMENLLASPGAIVSMGGKLGRIPTLVPQRKPDQTCKFLDADKRCAIHAVSPFGCRAFDCHMSQREADTRSSRGLQAIAREWMTGGLYARIWTLLHTTGLVAPCPIEGRSRLRKATASRQPR
jgi:Fe-S-cluster containining protein